MTDRVSTEDTVAEPAIKPVRHQSLPDAVVADLRRAIVNGRLAPGERIVEVEVAEQMQVSRATLRRALHQLEYEGLIETLPRRGAVVSRMSTQVAAEVCQVRGLLEGSAARAACKRLTPESIEHMRGLAQQMGEFIREGDLLKLVEIDIAFHSLICEHGPNRRLLQLWRQLNSLHAAVLASRLAHYHYDWRLVVQLHEDLCDVLAAKEPDAVERAVREHYAVREWEEIEMNGLSGSPDSSP